jgi:hypothetical protein
MVGSFSKFLDGFGIPTSRSSQFNELKKMLQELVQEEMNQRTNHGDYLDGLIESNVPQEFIWSHIAHVLLCSHASSTASLGWTCYQLGKNTKLKKIVLNELVKNGTKQFGLCLTETSRLYSPLSLCKTNPTRLEKFQYKFKPGSTIYSCPLSVHINEEFYENATEYKPERWLKINPETAKKRGKLVPINGNSYDHSLDRFLYQWNQVATKVLLGIGFKLVTTDAQPNYFSTITCPWPSKPITCVFGKEHSKKLK